ncbi:MAG TPA: succinate dehydrogenase iron-sulfur subunit [Dehalococcoidia bacterium]|nr:succinate dehydrogenase iron-sulfur subunit [Dehalococcoidia bacterium]
MKVKLKVRRTDPERGATGYSQYQIDMPESATLLDALIHVREYEDGTLSLRCSCRSAICGSCAMRVDKRARLACRAKIIAITGGDEDHEILVEPMGNMPVIKDLVIDQALFWDKIRAVDPYLQPVGPVPEREYRVPNEAMLDLTHTMNCIMCGACVSDCTVLEVDKNFIAPAALAKAYRFAGDPRDGHTRERLEKLSEYSGIWDCTRCNMCVEVCPKGVAPMNRILQLREMAVEAGIQNNAGARHTNIFTRSIKDGGRLNEVWMVPGSVGLFNVPRLLAEMPGALKMLRAGKLPVSQMIPPGAPGSHKMHGMDRLRNVIRKAETLKPVPATIVEESES